jgi:hypothetical protein
MVEQKRKRIWVQDVAVAADVLDTRLAVARSRGLGPSLSAVADGVEKLVSRARDAAFRVDPIPGRWLNWWRGTLVDAAYHNVHAARGQMVDLYDDAEVDAEVPAALARVQATLHRDDPRSVKARGLATLDPSQRRIMLRRLVEDGYEAQDLQHARLRSFRNILLMAAFSVLILVGATVLAVAINPTVMPLCFPREVPRELANASATVERNLNCPTGSNRSEPLGGDVLIVALLGLLGGALTAAISIRNLKGTSTPYDVPVALAMLKVPLGAFTAILGLVAIQGDFVPGLSVLDSQGQILAYALIFGFAQQVFTRLLDRQAEGLLSGLPVEAASTPTNPSPPPLEPPVPRSTPEASTDAETDAMTSAPVLTVTSAQVDDGPLYLPNPDGDEEGQVQDLQEEPLPDVPEQDHR